MTVTDSINTLIAAANIAQKKGIYSLEESHYIYLAISNISSVNQQAQQDVDSVDMPQQEQQASSQVSFVDEGINVASPANESSVFKSPGI